MNRFWMFLILGILCGLFGFAILSGTPAFCVKIAMVVFFVLAIVVLLPGMGGTP